MRRLAQIADAEPELARREAWEQIRLAGQRAGSRRSQELDSLNRIFRCGRPPTRTLDGPMRGILVTTSTFPVTDPLFRALASLWLPWVGKRFDAAGESGDNIMLPSARWPAKLFWPGYRLTDSGDGRYTAFRFRTHTDPGTVDPDIDTFKIDYDSDDNPGFLIRDILDELVEIVPGAYLGKVLLRTGAASAPKWNLVAYFALEPVAAAG